MIIHKSFVCPKTGEACETAVNVGVQLLDFIEEEQDRVGTLLQGESYSIPPMERSQMSEDDIANYGLIKATAEWGTDLVGEAHTIAQISIAQRMIEDFVDCSARVGTCAVNDTISAQLTLEHMYQSRSRVWAETISLIYPEVGGFGV